MCELGKGIATFNANTSIHNAYKELINILYDALYDIETLHLQRQLSEVFATDYVIQFAFPSEELDGPAELIERAYHPLIWLGIAPAGQKLTRRGLDFWRCEHGLIRESWVLVDLLQIYDQLGVDVFERLRELTVSRQVNLINV